MAGSTASGRTGPGAALRDLDGLTDEDVAAIGRRLDRLDQASRHGPWTSQTLVAIRDDPAVRAADLAASLGRETQPVKIDVRKLKELGLTESLEIGYRLSPRSTAYLALATSMTNAATAETGSPSGSTMLLVTVRGVGDPVASSAAERLRSVRHR